MGRYIHVGFTQIIQFAIFFHMSKLEKVLAKFCKFSTFRHPFQPMQFIIHNTTCMAQMSKD
jgi:hypothetical protein